MPSDMAAALPCRTSALRARLSGCAAPPAARLPAASGPASPRASRDPAAMVTAPPAEPRMWPAPASPADRACALRNPRADRQRARRCGAESPALPSRGVALKGSCSASAAVFRGGFSTSPSASHQSRLLVFVRLTLKGARGLGSVPSCSFWSPGIQKVILPDLCLRL